MTDIMTGGMILAVHDARDACRGEPDVVERLRKAMRACHDHWMETVEDNQFRSAVAAATLESEGAERDRIVRSAQALRKMAAALTALSAGVPLDLEAMLAEPRDEDLIPLTQLWHETKRQTAP